MSQYSSIRVSTPAILLLAELKIRKGSPAAAVDLLAAVDQGTAADCSGAIPARLCLFGPTEEGSSLGGLPSDGGIIPERSSTPVAHGIDTVGTRPAAGGAQGVREISRDFAGLSAGDRKARGPGHRRKSNMPPQWSECRNSSIRTQSWRNHGP